MTKRSPTSWLPASEARRIERDAVVSWLRGQADAGDRALLNAIEGIALRRDLAAGVVAIRRAADSIEKGSHRND